MTGRELIIFILENGLEDEVFFEAGKLPGLMTVEEAAAKYHVGPATMAAWHLHGFKKGVMIGGSLYFPVKQTEERGNGNE